MNVYDDDGLLLNTFAIVRDISEIVDGIEQHAVEKNRLDAVKAVLKEYNVHIDNVLHESDIRLITTDDPSLSQRGTALTDTDTLYDPRQHGL